MIVAGALAPGVAHAQASDADRATARSLAREGYDAQQQTQYAIAADRFTRANALVHAPTLLLGLARAQVGLGKLVEAQETYERIVREPLQPNAPSAFARAVEDAKKEVAGLAPRLAWVTIDVGAAASSSEVTLDNVAVPVAALGVRRACDPGTHWIQASAAGFAPTQRTFVASEGSDQTVSLAMEPLAPAPASPALVVVPVETSHSMSTPTKVAVASLAVGGAGLITGGVVGIMVLSRHSSIESDCNSGPCPSQYDGEVNTYRGLATVSTVAFIVGGVGVAAGLTLLFAAPKGAPVSAYVGPTGGGVVGTF